MKRAGGLATKKGKSLTDKSRLKEKKQGCRLNLVHTQDAKIVWSKTSIPNNT